MYTPKKMYAWPSQAASYQGVQTCTHGDILDTLMNYRKCYHMLAQQHFTPFPVRRQNFQ